MKYWKVREEERGKGEVLRTDTWFRLKRGVTSNLDGFGEENLKRCAWLELVAHVIPPERGANLDFDARANSWLHRLMMERKLVLLRLFLKPRWIYYLINWTDFREIRSIRRYLRRLQSTIPSRSSSGLGTQSFRYIYTMFKANLYTPCC